MVRIIKYAYTSLEDNAKSNSYIPLIWFFN